MAIKSKNTDTFKGMVSWLCLIVILCIVSAAAALLVLFLLIPGWARDLAFNLADFSDRVYPVRPQAWGGDKITVILYGLCALGLLILLFVFAFVFRQDRLAFEASIARGLGKIWMEVKLCAIVLLFFFCIVLLDSIRSPFGVCVVACIPVLVLYFLCLDVGHNKRFFSHNIIHSVLVRANNYRQLPSFEKRSLRRVYSCLGVVLAIVLFTLGILVILRNRYIHFPSLFYVGVALFGTIGAGGTIWWYILALKQDLRDWNVLMDQIAEMYGGDLNAVNHVPPTSNLYHCAMQLNSIRLGIQKAVDEGVKADRTKVELITNVSHDIKTPLTSIVSYIELLKKEEGLPPHVVDYVNTISQKADRLSHIVQDVFEVSKAATGNISLDLEDLDLGKLLRQTFAEMEETVESSHLTWRVEIPETPILIHADGQRLYRVFQNLIRNCAQYSLEGSRVYVQLSTQEEDAQVSLRNVSKSEISMEGEDLTARFVRGDQNRTTEGSGLGLSIAKSFTEACGGSFRVHTDGDLFLATVRFPLAPSHVPSLTLQPDPPQA